MATTKVSQIIIKKDILSNLPVLAAGEFMLAKDEQRLFLGQEPIIVAGNLVGTSTTTATVKFSVKEVGVVKELDLDAISEFSIVVYDSVADTTAAAIPASSVTINDSVLVFNHGLSRASVVGDTFTLQYNKEIMSYAGEAAGSNKLYSTAFTNSGGAIETTGIDFESTTKNSITIDYTLFKLVSSVLDKVRKGTLNILIMGSTVSHIEDSYIGDSELDDVDFSISNSGTTFTLNFKTATTTQLNFDYTQISTQNS
jgi:hypothetical protein|tara:strand:- start:2380 stop:3144 length:765 start_codon:yes stop_codon:yes gene_type:complete